MNCESVSFWVDVFQIIGVIVAIIGAFLAYLQWKHGKLVERIFAIRKITREFHSNPDTNKFIHDIDYNKKWYPDGFHDSERERIVDVALQDLNYICYLRRMKLIGDNELNLARYELTRCLQNSQLQEYLRFINNFAKGNKTESPFAELVRYGIQQKILDESTFNN